MRMQIERGRAGTLVTKQHLRHDDVVAAAPESIGGRVPELVKLDGRRRVNTPDAEECVLVPGFWVREGRVVDSRLDDS
jgi:hypothetical protein